MELPARSDSETRAAHLRHALHVQLNEVSLVVLQDGQAHSEDDLEALRGSEVTEGRKTPPRLQRMLPTSYMKISKMRVATGNGRKVRKRVRNQDEAYMEVWKLWERKWTLSSGSCS